MAEQLFSGNSLHLVLEQRLDSVQEFVDGIPKAQFQNASDDVLVEHVVSELALERIEVNLDKKTMDVEEALVPPSAFYSEPIRRGRQMGVPGARITVDLPFAGDASLLKLQPSATSGRLPHAIVTAVHGGSGGNLRFIFDRAEGVPWDQVKQQIDRQLGALASSVTAQARQVESYQLALPARARRAVEVRRARLCELDELPTVLGIPLTRNPQAPDILPIRRRLARPLPSAPSAGFSPEPGITDGDYEHILRVIRHEGRTFEALPFTFCKFSEPELRDILLAHLNGHYGLSDWRNVPRRGKDRHSH